MVSTKKVIPFNEQVPVFNNIRRLLLKYTTNLIVEVDQPDSVYITYPNMGVWDERSRTLFAAVQMMDKTTALYLPELMHHYETIPAPILKDLAVYMNSQGVLHIGYIDQKLLMNLERVLRRSHRKTFAVVQGGCYS